MKFSRRPDRGTAASFLAAGLLWVFPAHAAEPDSPGQAECFGFRNGELVIRSSPHCVQELRKDPESRKELARLLTAAANATPSKASRGRSAADKRRRSGKEALRSLSDLTRPRRGTAN